jgi:hypothetical protein
MRAELDFYPTPAAATRVLIARFSLRGRLVLEPCAGACDMAREFDRVITADVDQRRAVDYYADARVLRYEMIPGGGEIDWTATNPPFNVATPIVRNFAEQGRPCAFLLRLSWVEPCDDRGEWLAKNPPAGMLVLPRLSFTGDRRTDSVTAAWMVWNVPPFGVEVIDKCSLYSYL